MVDLLGGAGPPSILFAFSLFRTRIATWYAYRVEKGPHFVPGLPNVTLIELRKASILYQDYHMLLLTLAGQGRGDALARGQPADRRLGAGHELAQLADRARQRLRAVQEHGASGPQRLLPQPRPLLRLSGFNTLPGLRWSVQTTVIHSPRHPL